VGDSAPRTGGAHSFARRFHGVWNARPALCSSRMPSTRTSSSTNNLGQIRSREVSWNGKHCLSCRSADRTVNMSPPADSDEPAWRRTCLPISAHARALSAPRSCSVRHARRSFFSPAIPISDLPSPKCRKAILRLAVIECAWTHGGRHMARRKESRHPMRSIDRPVRRRRTPVRQNPNRDLFPMSRPQHHSAGTGMPPKPEVPIDTYPRLHPLRPECGIAAGFWPRLPSTLRCR